MAIKIGSYNFNDPVHNANQLHPNSGVYVILGRNAHHEQWNVVDIGESGNVRDRVSNHDRAPCWQSHRHSHLAAAALYIPERQRMQIEQELRTQYNPPCGQR